MSMLVERVRWGGCEWCKSLKQEKGYEIGQIRIAKEGDSGEQRTD